jgi:hypothetical protein
VRIRDDVAAPVEDDSRADRVTALISTTEGSALVMVDS